jgi:signal transduction histidine kinase
MIDEAIRGNFVVEVYDETQLSAMETKLKHFLSACMVSAKNLQTEKNNINALISDISHQTKTPISNILLYAQLLSEEKLPEVTKEKLSALAIQAEKLDFLIASMIKASRLESGIISIIPRKNSLEELMASALEEIRPRAELRSIRIHAKVFEGEAVFDMRWMTEAFYNILDNAVKYSPEKSVIEITVKYYEAFYRIDIKDEGIGISEEEHSKIFTRFYRSQAVALSEGVGIGLYLTREIVAACGGFIQVSSILGKGSTFSVFLPV